MKSDGSHAVETDALIVRKVRMPIRLREVIEAAQLKDSQYRSVEVEVEKGRQNIEPRQQGTLNPIGPDQIVAWLIVELTTDTPKGHGLR